MGAVSNPALTEWMAEEGLASDKMTSMDWPKFDIGRTAQGEMDREIVNPIRTFFSRHTQKELWEEGAKRRVMVYPVNDAEGVLADGQLQERGFWVRMEHPPLGRAFAYPGAFVRTEKNLCGPRSPAPGIGEHNAVVYGELLGIGEHELSILKERQII
jgi:crotonobetainyl-CoA:carnitine CoA-transferase CaiB-like acyl-CoA transferase